MQNDRKLKRAVERTATFYERSGFRYSLCAGMLGGVFDLSLDSVYPKDPGVYVAVFIERVPEHTYRNILHYQTAKRKEIVLWMFDSKKKNDSGRPGTYRIAGSTIVEYPRNMPIEKVLASPRKRRARLAKVGSEVGKTGE